MLARVQFRGDYLFSVSQSVGVRMRPHRAYSQFLRILSATKNTIVNRLLLLIDAFPIHSSVFFSLTEPVFLYRIRSEKECK